MSICHARNRRSCAPTRRQSPSFAVWPLITQTPSSPVSSTVKIVIPLTVTALPPTMSAVCGGSGTSRASSRPLPSPEGELLTVKQAAAVLGTATSTIHRWLNDGFIGGEQLTPGAPWRIRLTEDLGDGFVNEAPKGFLTMYQAMRLL